MRCDNCGAEIGAPEPGDPWLCDACLEVNALPAVQAAAEAQLRRLRLMFKADGVLIVLARGRAVEYAQLADEGSPVADIAAQVERIFAKQATMIEQVRLTLPDRGRT